MIAQQGDQKESSDKTSKNLKNWLQFQIDFIHDCNIRVVWVSWTERRFQKFHLELFKNFYTGAKTKF